MLRPSLQRRLNGLRAGTVGLALAAALLCVSADSSCAQSSGGVQADAAAVAPFVSSTTVAIVKVDVAHVRMPSGDELAGHFPDPVRQAVKQAVARFETVRGALAEATGGVPVYATAGIPISQSRVPVFVFSRLPQGHAPQAAMQLFKTLGKGKPIQHGDYVVVAPEGRSGTAAVLESFQPETRSEFAAAWKAVGGYPVQVLFVPPDYVRRTVDELLPTLPREVGGGKSSVWTRGLQWAAVGIDPSKLKVDITIQSDSPESARALADQIPRAVRASIDALPQMAKKLPRQMIGQLIQNDRFTVRESTIHWRLDGSQQVGGASSVLGAIVANLQRRAGDTQQANRYKQVLLAVHNYYSAHRAIPPTKKHRDENGKPRLSWRVHILPFLGQAKLYDHFHLDEAWDSPHNIKLLPKMPDVYAIRRSNKTPNFQPKPGYTTCVAPVGKGTVMGGDEPVTFRDVIDGTSRTALLVEVQPQYAVPWTAPVDYKFDPKQPLDHVALQDGRRWLCALLDGSVQVLDNAPPAKMIVNLFQMNDGEIVDFDTLR